MVRTRSDRVGGGRWWLVAGWLLLLAGCGSDERIAGPTPDPDPDPDPDPVNTEAVPLNELQEATYLGFVGGLYPGGANEPPPTHFAAGVARGRAVQPLDTSGNPDPQGRYVFMSLGMSNTTQEFCTRLYTDPCTDWSFVGQARSDPAVNHDELAIVNGARGGQTVDDWDSPAEANYDRIRDEMLAPRGLTEAQVQVVWMKVARPNPSVSLPDDDADAYVLESRFGDIVRALAARYPNLKQVLVSSRTYGGYANIPLNPEPYAYESGFAVKWLIEAQIDEVAGRGVDAEAGPLDYDDGAPWLGWGPYLWADGTEPRVDNGLVWRRQDFEDDGTHPAQPGERKVGQLLHEYLKASPFTACWYLTNGTCG